MKCLKCGKGLDYIEAWNKVLAPRSGDIALCFFCGHTATYDRAGKLRELNFEEVGRLVEDAEYMAIINAPGKK